MPTEAQKQEPDALNGLKLSGALSSGLKIKVDKVSFEKFMKFPLQ